MKICKYIIKSKVGYVISVEQQIRKGMVLVVLKSNTFVKNWMQNRSSAAMSN